MSDERVLNVTEFLASWRNKDIRSYLEELVWQHVSENDATNVKVFTEFREQLCGEMTDFMKDGWFVRPVAIANQDLFHILMQPALSCHSVLTLSEGPSLVTGWEGQLKFDC